MNARRVIEARARILAREAPRKKRKWFFDYFVRALTRLDRAARRLNRGT